MEPPWGVEPQTYALRVDLQLSASTAITEFGGLIHAFGCSVGTARLRFVDSFVDSLHDVVATEPAPERDP